MCEIYTQVWRLVGQQCTESLCMCEICTQPRCLLGQHLIEYFYVRDIHIPGSYVSEHSYTC